MRGPRISSRYAEKGDNEVVKAIGAKLLPVIKQHLEEGKRLVG